MAQRVLIAGVGMTPFVAAGGYGDAVTLAARAIRSVLDDARIDGDLVDQIYTSSGLGETGAGERLALQAGFSRLPIFNLQDGCAAASDAFHLARQSVLSGEADCVLVVGVECLSSGGSSQQFFGTREASNIASAPPGVGDHLLEFLDRRQHPATLFAEQADWLMTRTGVARAYFEQVNEHAQVQARLNPFAMAAGDSSRPDWLPPYVCPPASGAAAILLCSASFAARFGTRADLAILACVRGSDTVSEHENHCVLDVLGRATTRRVVQQAYLHACLGAEDIDVVELHDQSVGDFMMNSAALGFCQESEIDRFVRQRYRLKGRAGSVCPSGGLLGRGHAPGASSLAQIIELVWQLREEARGRQIVGARTGLQHSCALGRAVSVTILQRT